MTKKEIDEIQELINQNNIEELKNYIEKKKIIHFNQKRQNSFESYLYSSEKRKPVLFNDRENETIICSNGISIYYINYNYIYLNSSTLITKKPFQELTTQEVKLLDESKQNYITELGPAPFFTRNRNTTLVEGFKGRDKTFNTNEIDFADSILDFPEYKIDEKYPLLYGESKVGKVYILGYKKSNTL